MPRFGIATGVVNVFYQCALREASGCMCVCKRARESSFYGDKDKVERNKQIKTHIYSDKPVAIYKI